jgi:hypothetical protein
MTLTRANQSFAVASPRDRSAPQFTARVAARALAAAHDFAPRANTSAKSAQSAPECSAGSNATSAEHNSSTS